MTSLQKQLAAIAASSTRQLDLNAQKAAHGKSLLFEPEVAASQSFDTLHLICYAGFLDLCGLDHRFVQFSKSLFSEQSKAEDRTQMTAKENKELDLVLEAFVTLVGSKLLLKPAEKALEWLVRRFRIHEYNTECLVLTYLPYHATPQFLALLSILPPSPPPTLRFLHPYITSPTNIPRQTLVYTAVHTGSFFQALQSYVVRVLQAGHQGPILLSFWSSITTQAIDAILENTQSGRRSIQDQRVEELLLRILPSLNECLRLTDVPEAVIGCYMVIVVLVTKVTLDDKVLDALLEAVVLGQDDNGTLDDCLKCMAVIAEERSRLSIPFRVIGRLLELPLLTRKMASLATTCRVERLALGCALGVLESLRDVTHTASYQALFVEILDSGLLRNSQVRVALSTLLHLARGSTTPSERAQYLETIGQLADARSTATTLRPLVEEYSKEIESLGIDFHQGFEPDLTENAVSEDEEVLDAEDTERAIDEPLPSFPTIDTNSFLDKKSASAFKEASRAFEQVVTLRPSFDKNVATEELQELRPDESFKTPLFFSFLIRVWCGSSPVAARLTALRFANKAIKGLNQAIDLQILVPYLIYALGDHSPSVRRAAAACIASMSGRTGTDNVPIWGTLDVYGDESSNMFSLQPEQTSTLLSTVLVPILEECAMDSNFVVTAIRHLLEGTFSGKDHSRANLKASVRSSLASFLSSHVALTPLLRVRLRLLPVFDISGKHITSVRHNTILPVLRLWFSWSDAEIADRCVAEDLDATISDENHLAALMPRERDSIALLKDLISGEIGPGRISLLTAAFNRLNTIWPSLRSDFRLPLGQALLDIALRTSETGNIETVRISRSLEVLRTVHLDTTVLMTFVESVPLPSHMPEGPPTKKRRRSSRNSLGRADIQTPEDLSKFLKRLTLILELVESSNPGEHPALFKHLFTIFDELQQLKQQSGSDLIYLQSLVLSSLSPMVKRLREEKNNTEYQASVRADILVDCIRHSGSPQVQNAALLLVADLASLVPELVLHNLMPIFTFIGSNLLRQKDDYSVHVVDQTISKVVPQLASSLKSKHRNFLQGVADLLLSFTAAFEHIPQNRRLRLFRELAQTLGPEDALPAITSLLFDRYPANPDQRKFIPELLQQFEPIMVLYAFKGYLDLVADAVGTKRKITDTLFSLNEKQPAQVESSLLNLLGSLADLSADTSIRSHVRRAFKRPTQSSQARKVFASILEVTIQVSKQVSKNQPLYNCCRQMIANCLDLLPTLDLIKSAEMLLDNPEHQVQVTGLKAVESRASNTPQSDSSSVAALLEFLPRIERALVSPKNGDVMVTALSCVDRIVERFGKKDISKVAHIAKTVSGAGALASTEERVRILSLLCLSSMVTVLEEEAISLLPTILPLALDYLKESIEYDKAGLHNAVLSLLSDIVDNLAFLFSREYLVPVLNLSHRSAAANLSEACGHSRERLYRSISKHIDAQEAFFAIKATWGSAIEQGYAALMEHFQLVLLTIESQARAMLLRASPILFSFFLEAFHLRSAMNRKERENILDNEELSELEDRLNEAVLTMTLKLNDATFRPFFAQLVEQTGTKATSDSRVVTFYKFLIVFFDRFKSIATSYSSYIVEPAATLLLNLADSDRPEQLQEAIMKALHNSFKHDQDGFWQAPSHYSMILGPLVANLQTYTSAEANSALVIPTITELAAASSSSIDNHRELNSLLLKHLRSDEASTRLATVLCEQSLTQRLGEEWLALLPEMLPIISELREDDDEMVERETQRWITMVEEVLGENLDEMLS